MVFPITLLIFICTFNCFKLIANTTNVSHGVTCWLPALFDLLNGVDVFDSRSGIKHKANTVNVILQSITDKNQILIPLCRFCWEMHQNNQVQIRTCILLDSLLRLHLFAHNSVMIYNLERRFVLCECLRTIFSVNNNFTW